jgi:hypothetical protein
MNAQTYREDHAKVTRLCATALRTKKPVTIPADLSGAFATAGEATTYTPTQIRNYINRVLVAVGRYNPAWGIATAAPAALADAIEAELTYTPTGNTFGSAFTSDALSRCAGKARSDADTSFVDGRRARTRKATISAEDKVWLRANCGNDWFGANGKTDPVRKQASLAALAAHKAGGTAPTRTKFGTMVVAPEVTVPAHLQALVEEMRARGKTEAEVQAVVSALA